MPPAMHKPTNPSWINRQIQSEYCHCALCHALTDWSWSHSVEIPVYCPENYRLYNGRCFGVHHNQLNFSDAETECNKLPGGHLVAFRSQKELDFIKHQRFYFSSFHTLGYKYVQQQQCIHVVFQKGNVSNGNLITKHNCWFLKHLC